MLLTDFDRLYRRTLIRAGTSGATVTLDLDPVAPGRIRVLTHITIEDQSNSYTLCRLSIFNTGIDFPLDEALNPAKQELLIHNHDVLLGEGDILRATLTGTTDLDRLVLIACGWELTRIR